MVDILEIRDRLEELRRKMLELREHL